MVRVLVVEFRAVTDACTVPRANVERIAELTRARRARIGRSPH